MEYEIDLEKIFEYKVEPPEEVLAVYAAEDLILKKGSLIVTLKHQEIEAMAGVESSVSFSMRGRILKHLKRLYEEKLQEELNDDAIRKLTLINARRRNYGVV